MFLNFFQSSKWLLFVKFRMQILYNFFVFSILASSLISLNYFQWRRNNFQIIQWGHDAVIQKMKNKYYRNGRKPTISYTSVLSTKIPRLVMRVLNTSLLRNFAAARRWPWPAYLQVDFSRPIIYVKCESYYSRNSGSSLNYNNIWLGKCPPEGNVYPVDAQLSWMQSSAVFVLISRSCSWRAETTEHVFVITVPFAWRPFRYSGFCLYSPLSLFKSGTDAIYLNSAFSFTDMAKPIALMQR